MEKYRKSSISDRMKKADFTSELGTRISLSLGLTLKTGVQYQMIKPEVGVELTVPDGMSADEAFEQTYLYLEEQLAKVIDNLQSLTGDLE